MSTQKILARILLALACWPSAVSSANELVVWPERLVVSKDYPARIAVTERTSPESLVDRTHASDLTVTFSESAGLAYRAGGWIEIDEAASAVANEAVATVRYGNAQAEVPVQIISRNASSPTFPREVSAVLGKAGCNLGTCHGNLHGKAGFRLSLRGDDPVLDYTAIVRGAAGRRVDRFVAPQSLLLRKALGQTAHQGGARFSIDSPESKILRRWIEEGCQWNAVTGAPPPESLTEPRPDETVTSLKVFPPQALLVPSCRQQQLVVLAQFADGATRDVTAFARYEPSVPSGVEISADGLVRATGAVDVAVSVSYLSGRSASRLTFLARESSTWSEPPADSKLDQLVERQLRRLQITPQPLADDYVFVRRAYLKIVGRLPTADEVRAYVERDRATDAHAPGDKAARLIDQLLSDPGYALLWSLRWSDLLRNEQKVMSEKGAEGWHQWMTTQIAADRPLNEFVAEMLTTLGSTYENPAASFHRTHRDPEAAAESIGQVFLGVRLQCARCHNHPFDKWRQDDYYGLAAYFTTLERKQVGNDPKDKFDKHIISGDEVVSYKEKLPATIWHPGRAATVDPKPLLESRITLSSHASEDVTRPQASKKDDSSTPGTIEDKAATEKRAEEAASDQSVAKPLGPLDHLAGWLTVNNRMFARNMANRIWYHYMSVGIVDPPDDFRDSNPASNPELLEYLTDELIASGYSTRHLARLILTSRTFRRASAAEPTAEQPLGGARVFSGYPLHRMPAEVLYDALSDVTGVHKTTGEKGEPLAKVRALERVEVPTKAGFLSTFGKPGRLLVCECERSSEVSLGQSLVLVNGLETRDKLAAKGNVLGRMLEGEQSLSEVIETLYLQTLARPPRGEEARQFADYVEHSPSRRQALEDVLWVLINSKEFPLVR